MSGLDLTSADGRCGIKSLLAEIERLSPGAILQQAAGIQLRRLPYLDQLAPGSSVLPGSSIGI